MSVEKGDETIFFIPFLNLEKWIYDLLLKKSGTGTIVQTQIVNSAVSDKYSKGYYKCQYILVRAALQQHAVLNKHIWIYWILYIVIQHWIQYTATLYL